MIANLQPHPDYKESEQAWLGRVPKHWPVLPNRALFAEVKDREHPDEEMLSVTITKGIIRQKALLMVVDVQVDPLPYDNSGERPALVEQQNSA